MVKSIYFLKPAWCGTHFAGLGPEQGLQPVTRATAFRRWFVTDLSLLWYAHRVERAPDKDQRDQQEHGRQNSRQYRPLLL
jgi:hypothetical protein